MTALERIARALAAQHWRDAGASEEQVLAFADIDWPEFVPDARAALTALREPDDRMLQAADALDVYPLGSSTPSEVADFEIKWQAAIDAALQEGQ